MIRVDYLWLFGIHISVKYTALKMPRRWCSGIRVYIITITIPCIYIYIYIRSILVFLVNGYDGTDAHAHGHVYNIMAIITPTTTVHGVH